MAILIILLRIINRIKHSTVENGQENVEAETVELSTSSVKASSVSSEMNELVKTTKGKDSNVTETEVLNISEEFEEINKHNKLNEAANPKSAKNSKKVEERSESKEEMIPIITEPVFNKIDPSLLGYTEEQYQSLNRLIKDIQARNPKIKRNRTQILGHDEYTSRKTDLGKLFDWSKIGF